MLKKMICDILLARTIIEVSDEIGVADFVETPRKLKP